jgi:hypothetical protein
MLAKYAKTVYELGHHLEDAPRLYVFGVVGLGGIAYPKLLFKAVLFGSNEASVWFNGGHFKKGLVFRV